MEFSTIALRLNNLSYGERIIISSKIEDRQLDISESATKESIFTFVSIVR